MTNADPDKIRKVLREEIPEFRGVGSPTSLLGNLVMAVGSIGICSVVGAGAFWLLTEMVESDYEDTTLILVMILSPILGFVVKDRLGQVLFYALYFTLGLWVRDREPRIRTKDVAVSLALNL